jgi:anti-sigma factor RsiW
MCEERERLIGYVYDECDATERRTIEAHLESCPTCRHEIGGLRKVRHDLLAWEVPDHPRVWRPVAPAVPSASPWASIPAWALTAAAGLLLMVGAAGGAATYALMPRPMPQVAAVAPAAVNVPATPAVNTAQIAAMEQRIAELERVSVSARPAVSNPSAAELANMKTTVNSLLGRVDDLDYALARTAINAAEVRTDQQKLRNSFIMQTSLAGTPGSAPGFGGAR